MAALWSKGLERAMGGEPRLEEVYNMVKLKGLQFLIAHPVTTETETQIISVENLWDYLREISELNDADDTFPIYRGQPNTAFKLLPKIGRKTLKSKYTENDMFLEFKRNYRRYYPHVLTRDMDILMLGQHYGLSTRLLDWTTNPLVALYFACCTNEKADGVVYQTALKSDNRYTDEKVDVNPFTYKDNIFIFPEIFETRFANQSGLFELFANPRIESKSSVKAKITIKNSFKKSILKQLSSINMDPVELFPTLDNLCKSIEISYLN